MNYGRKELDNIIPNKDNGLSDWQRAVNGLNSANQQMGNLITDTKKFYSGFNSSINILITNKDEIKSDIIKGYNNAHPALRESINVATTIVEYGVPLKGAASVGYDYYSGENFITYPTSIVGV